jgi:hypothetical protein
MAATLATDQARPAPPGPVVRLPIDDPSAPLAAILEPAILACDAAISYRVREGTRPAGGGLLTALVDAIEVGQTCLDLARRSSPLVPAARDLCRTAFARAEAACRERGDAPLRSCAHALAEAAACLRPVGA